jgi:23S rRNA (adenine2503-C2)-methyltransferase
MGFGRNLTPGEIFEQAARYAAELRQEGERLSNVVLMGMGEPFHNYDAVMVAVRRLMEDLGIGARRITVSTVGLVPAIRRFAQEGLQVGLAISLHAADDEERSALMPVNRRWPIEELLAACRDYVEATGRRVTFEWALIAGENDDEGTARRLGRLLRGLSCHVNLIPLNPTRGYGGEATAADRAEAFVAVLEGMGIPATLRVRRGIDIDAGCGQLTSKHAQEGALPLGAPDANQEAS